MPILPEKDDEDELMDQVWENTTDLQATVDRERNLKEWFSRAGFVQVKVEYWAEQGQYKLSMKPSRSRCADAADAERRLRRAAQELGYEVVGEMAVAVAEKHIAAVFRLRR